MNTNFHTESRMREICTYGSMRGRAYPTRGVPLYSTPRVVAWDEEGRELRLAPPVPKEYWLDANEEPAAYAFGMRPPECRVLLWNGDSSSLESLRIGE